MGEKFRELSRLAILGEILRKTANHKFTIFYYFKDEVYCVAIPVAVKSSQPMVFSARISA
jgi:hypothetical protein